MIIIIIIILLMMINISSARANAWDDLTMTFKSEDANIDPYLLNEGRHSFINPPKYDNPLNIVYDNGLKIIGNDSQGQYNITLKLFIESDTGQKTNIAASKNVLDFIKINSEAFRFNISMTGLSNKTKYVGLDFETSKNVKSINKNDIYPDIMEVHGGNSMIMIDFSDVKGYSPELNESSIKIPTNSSTNLFIDPQVNFTSSQTNTIYLEPFNSNKFVLAWCDGATADGLFQFWDTSGTNTSRVFTVDSDLGSCGTGQIAVATLNSTHIVVAWINATATVQDSYFQVYEINGNYNATPKGAIITVDNSMGAANRINVDAFNSTHFILVWNDLGTSTAIATYAVYDSTTAKKVAATQLDTNCGGNQQIGIAASALNSTHAVVVFSDRTDADITYAIVQSFSTTRFGPIDADTSAGTGVQFVDVTALNSTYFAIGYHNNAESDATLFINTSNMIGGPSKAGDVHTSIGTGGWLGIAKFNDTHTVFAYQDGDTNDLGSNISSTITSLKYKTFGVLYAGVSVAKNKTATNIAICNDNFIIAYGTNATNGYWETYDSGYNSWNGICPTTADTTLPTWSLNQTNSTLAGTPILHSLNWTDNIDMSGYTFSFDNCTGVLANDTWIAFNSVHWSNVTKTVNSTICTIRWQVFANDTSNNWNASSIYTYITTDITPPIVTIQYPTNTTYNNSVAIWANVTLNEAGSWCGVVNDSNSVNLTMTNSSGNYNYNFNAPLLAKGVHNVRFYCNDTTGNMNGSTSNIVYFTIDNTLPIPSNVGTNNTSPTISNPVLFYANWTDDVALSHWIFSWNGTGALCGDWANDTEVAFDAGTWSNATKTYPIGCFGKTVDYIFYVNDTSNNWNNTGITVGGTETGTCQVYINILPYNITQNNTYYCLNTSTNTPIVAPLSGIQFGNKTMGWNIENSTLDCINHSNYITADRPFNVNFGVFINSTLSRNNTIMNCNISSFYYEIYALNTLNVNVTNVRVNRTLGFSNVTFGSIEDSIFNSIPAQNALSLGNSENITLFNNTFINNVQAITLGESRNITIKNNTITKLTNTQGYIDWIGSNYNPAYHNSHWIDEGNTINGKVIRYYGGQNNPCPNNQVLSFDNVSNIELAGCVNVTIKGMNVSDGISLFDTINCTIDSNIINDTKYAIYTHNNTNATAINNTVSYSYIGWYEDIYDNNTQIYNNTFLYNADGIFIYATENVVFYNNSLIGNTNRALMIYNSYYTRIYNNFFNNTLSVSFYTKYGTGETHYWNTSNQAGTRIYSNGTNIGGNYWSDPTGGNYSDSCADINQDGFCDSPFNVTTLTSCTFGIDCGPDVDYLPYSNNYSVTTTIPMGVCVNETGNCFGTIQQGINNATDYQTVIIYNESAIFNENIVVNKSIFLTSNSTIYPKINSTDIYIPVMNVTGNDTVISRINFTHTIGGTIDQIFSYPPLRGDLTVYVPLVFVLNVRNSTLDNCEFYSNKDADIDYINAVIVVHNSTINITNDYIKNSGRDGIGLYIEDHFANKDAIINKVFNTTIITTNTDNPTGTFSCTGLTDQQCNRGIAVFLDGNTRLINVSMIISTGYPVYAWQNISLDIINSTVFGKKLYYFNEPINKTLDLSNFSEPIGGIMIMNPLNLVIKDLVINNATGVFVYRARNVTFMNNSMDNITGTAFGERYYYGTYITSVNITGNNITLVNSGAYGIKTRSNATIVNNNIRTLKSDCSSTICTINLAFGHYCYVVGNNITGAGTGAKTIGADYSYIGYNYFYRDLIGDGYSWYPEASRNEYYDSNIAVTGIYMEGIIGNTTFNNFTTSAIDYVRNSAAKVLPNDFTFKNGNVLDYLSWGCADNCTNDIGAKLYIINSTLNMLRIASSSVSSGNNLNATDSYIGNITMNGNYTRNFLINVTTPVPITFNPNRNGSVYVGWYLGVEVRDITGNLIPNANISFYNVSNIMKSSYISTDGTRNETLIEYLQNKTNKFYETNYTVNASATGYYENTTLVNLTENKYITITLIPAINISFKINFTGYQVYSSNEFGVQMATAQFNTSQPTQPFTNASIMDSPSNTQTALVAMINLTHIGNTASNISIGLNQSLDENKMVLFGTYTNDYASNPNKINSTTWWLANVSFQPDSNQKYWIWMNFSQVAISDTAQRIIYINATSG